ncbi:gp051 [Rhodococcus phage ReqiPoco6]|uniref:Gp051 n=1 Tax=Rhodococcus phage ReqiPoco6 TaxID=691964 RepID=D4P7R9_9CAUD|nr:gp051 [Rhodococcus phage ReqiPoco6]ADD81049.1 gp051 [Rhodococcus phage ReqiPoco6]
MQKAALILSALSLATSVTTLAVILGGVKKLNDDIQDIRKKTNDAIGKMKAALVSLDFRI